MITRIISLCLVALAVFFTAPSTLAVEEEAGDTLILEALRSAGLPDQPQAVIGGTVCFRAEGLQGVHCDKIKGMSVYMHYSNAGYGPVLTLNLEEGHITYWSVGEEELYNGRSVTWFKFYPKEN
jgi:hypothetical protein